MMWKEKSCGAVIHRHAHGREEYLIIQQVQGHWCFPKGHMEKGEKETETAVREIREETGAQVRLDPAFHTSVTYSPKPGVLKDVIYFTGTVTGGKERVQESEVQKIVWASEREAYGILTYANDAEVLKKACAYLKGKKR